MTTRDYRPVRDHLWLVWDILSAAVTKRMPFGLFPGWGRYQDFRQWRDLVAVPAVKSWLRRG